MKRELSRISTKRLCIVLNQQQEGKNIKYVIPGKAIYSKKYNRLFIFHEEEDRSFFHLESDAFERLKKSNPTPYNNLIEKADYMIEIDSEEVPEYEDVSKYLDEAKKVNFNKL